MRVNTRKQKALPAAVLRKRVFYDPATGVMAWRKARYRTLLGKEVGTVSPSGYRTVVIGGAIYMVHRLVWLHVHGSWPAADIDHINGRRDDNRLCNLREATRSQNNANRTPRALGGLKGATLHRHSGRWQAQIGFGGRNVFLGTFSSPEEAHAVYAAKAREVHGEFARVK